MSATRYALCGVLFLLQLAPVLVLAAEVGSSVPKFSLPSLHNPHETLSLSSILSSNLSSKKASERGKLLYVDFWSAWCKPCREKMPQLDALRATQPSLEVIGINVDSLVSDAYQFLARYPVSYPIALDIGGKTARSYGVETLPVGYLIDEQGIVRAITRSGSTEEIQQLTSLIDSLAISMRPAEIVR